MITSGTDAIPASRAGDEFVRGGRGKYVRGRR
jgi:hypothetical protein